MSSYLSCGNIMSDVIIQPGGEKSNRHMGGPAFFALSGIKLWQDDCLLVTHTGANYTEDYGKWLDANKVPKDFIRVDAEVVTCYQIAYDEHGRGIREKSFSYYGDECMGYLKTHPRDIAQAVGRDTLGVYMAQGADRVVWEQLAAIKKKYGFKLMWELEHFNTGKDLEKIVEVMPNADAWSLNHSEAAELFGIDKEDDLAIIRRLQQLPVDFTFYRVGKKGAYAVTPTEAYFCEAASIGPYVDQTGCGNCSTGAAMYALVSGRTPAEVVVMANIASGYNCLQYGPYPLYTPEVRAQAEQLRQSYLARVKKVL